MNLARCLALFGCLFMLAAAAETPLTQVKINFDDLPVGPVPASTMVIDGEFRITAIGSNHVLEMQAEPVADGALLLGPTLPGAGRISAKVKAEKSRRAFPRLGLGLFGVSGLKVRLVPARHQVELLHGESVIATAPFEWKENVWWSMELDVRARAGQWLATARVWEADAPRPEQPALTAKLDAAPGAGRASVLGSPYANKVIHFDEVEITSVAAN